MQYLDPKLFPHEKEEQVHISYSSKDTNSHHE